MTLTLSDVLNREESIINLVIRFLNGVATKEEEEFVIYRMSPQTLLAIAIYRGHRP